MNKTPRNLSEEQRLRLHAVLTTYIQQKQSGAAVSRRKLLDAHPDLAKEIQAWFNNQSNRKSVDEALTEQPVESVETTVLVNGVQNTESEFGRYRLLKILGEGAMGVVYLAHDTKLDRNVALKIPKAKATDNKEFMLRFERESKTAAALSHKNICRIFDAGEYNGTAFITMDFVVGAPLTDYIGKPELKSLETILGITDAIADGLQHAHENDVIHRDLKPGNILINSDLVPCVTDFGLARQITECDSTELTQEGTILGTPAYMAPEQIRGERAAVGPRSDVYSLGVILFQMLTGELPFTGSLPDVLAKSLRDDPPVPSRLRPDLTEDIDDLCLKMLNKNPATRFGSMAEVRAAIVAFKHKMTLQKRVRAEPRSTKKFDASKAKVYSLIKNGQYAAATRELEYFSQEERLEYAELSAWAIETLAKVRKESKALNPEGLKALHQTAQQMFQKNDYRGCIQLLSDIPVLYRSNGIDQLLRKATDAEASAEELMLQIKNKERKEDAHGLERLVKKFLKLKPQNKYARRLSAALQSYSDVSATRRGYSFENGKLKPYEKQTFVREWLTKGALVGTLVFAIMFAYVNNYLTREDEGKIERPPTATFESNNGDNNSPETASVVADSQLDAHPVSDDTPAVVLAVAPYTFSEAQNYQQDVAELLKVPSTVTNDFGMTLKIIPPGTFLMGSPETEKDREDDEGPQREVTISKAFYLQTTEVTKEQWQAVAGTEPWKGWKYNQPGPQYPAVSMNHADAVAFCEILSEKDGHYYRLPTEAEWEYACRAGSTSAWYCGDDVGNLNDHAWWGGFDDGTSKDEHYAHQVQQKRANAFGLYDMCGNVNEWCSDRYQADYYANGPAIDPNGPTIGDKFVVRGGAWVTGLELTRSANRGGSPAQQGRFGLGLRVIREVNLSEGTRAIASITEADSAGTTKAPTISVGLELNSNLTIISQIQGATEAQLDSWSKQLPQGYRPYWISHRTTGPEVLFDGLARQAPSDAKWILDYVNASTETDRYGSMRGPYRIAITNGYGVDENARIQILWVENTGSHEQKFNNLWGPEDYVHSSMMASFQASATPNEKEFLVPIHLSATQQDPAGSIHYHASQGMFAYPGIEFKTDLTPAAVRRQLPDYFARNWQLHLLAGIRNSPTERFTAVFVDRGESRVPWSVTMNLSPQKYSEALQKVDAIGGWPRCVSSGQYVDGLRHHVVWDNVGKKKLAAVKVEDGS